MKSGLTSAVRRALAIAAILAGVFAAGIGASDAKPRDPYSVGLKIAKKRGYGAASQCYAQAFSERATLNRYGKYSVSTRGRRGGRSIFRIALFNRCGISA